LDIAGKNVSVSMVRRDLDNIPRHKLPAGFSFHWFAEGNEELWVRINSQADRYNKITRKLFNREYGNNAEEKHKRICFIIDARRRAVGTASAWFNNSYHGEKWARLHWVAIIPEMQGKGLAKPLMTVICNRMRELGHDKSYLVTSTARVPAIHLYLTFGYRPEITDIESRNVWLKFQKETDLPGEIFKFPPENQVLK